MPSQEKESLIDRVFQLQVDMYRALRPNLQGEWLRADLTMPQLKVLLLLFMEGSARMSEIAHGLGVTLATATGIINRLVERNLVVREAQQGDRRVVTCELSEEGGKMMGRLWEAGQAWSRNILENLTTPQLEIVAEAMELLLKAAEGEHKGLPQTILRSRSGPGHQE